MSEDLSNSDESSSSEDRDSGAPQDLECVECGQSFVSLKRLISHYKAHNSKATCHICKVTFCRVTSLFTHLDNVHSVPNCDVCHQRFSSAWELNKHREMHCLGSAPFEGAPSCFTVSFPAIPFVNPLIPVKGGGGAGACPSGHWARGELHPGQATSPSQGTISYPSDNYSRLANPSGGWTNELADCKMTSNGLQKESLPKDCFSYIAQEHSYCVPFDSDSQWSSATAQCTDTETLTTPETPENTIEYTLGEDEDCYMETDCENLSTSETEDSQSNGSATDTCSESSYGSSSDVNVARSKKNFIQCSVCQNVFVSEESLRQHYTRLYSCTTCGQLFSDRSSLEFHPCSQNNSGNVYDICAESVLKACRICNAFFESETTLLTHIKTAHSLVVHKKLGADAKPSAPAVKSGLPFDSRTAARAGTRHTLGSCSTSIPQASRAGTRLSNGNLRVRKSYSGSSPAAVISSCLSLDPGASKVAHRGPNSVVPSTVSHVVLQQSTNVQVSGLTNGQPKISLLSRIQTPVSSSPGTSPAPVCNGSTAAFAAFSIDDAVVEQTNQPPGLTLESIPAGAMKKIPASATNQPASSPAPPVTILAMFKNNSQEAALLKRMNTNWRSKAPYPCRHCGAISRQPSLNIAHRYLHRGRRSHQCQCGRAFKHQLHLLRHCVQHAEAASYICVNCGRTFTGAKLLAGHITGNARNSKCRWKYRVRKRCSMPFSCDCGRLFVRPSAYIWHQLKNRAKLKR